MTVKFGSFNRASVLPGEATWSERERKSRDRTKTNTSKKDKHQSKTERLIAKL